MQSFRHRRFRNQFRAGYAADRVLFGLAHVYENEVIASIHLRFEFHRGDFEISSDRDLGLMSHSAKLVVINQLVNSGILSADWTLGILSEFQFAELHLHRVEQEQSPDQRIAFA